MELRAAFEHVTDWVFDLDNTLYPPSARLFDLIEVRMTDFVMGALSVGRERADHLRGHYWRTYGTTLAGLMREHGVDPGQYLHNVHDVSLESLTPDPGLSDALLALPGRKVVYTNGPAGYARRVLTARGIHDAFDAVYGVEEADFLPKPEHAAFDRVFTLAGINRKAAAMFEDDPRNLRVPKNMGLLTVHVAPQRAAEDHIDHHTDDLTGFLRQIG